MRKSKLSKKLTVILTTALGLLILGLPAQAATVTVSSSPSNSPANPILNSTGADLATGAFVQVIRSTDGSVSAPDPATGLPSSGTDTVVSTGTLSAPGTLTKGGNSVPTGQYVYVVAWETWNGIGTPTGNYGISVIAGPMSAASYIYRPASFRTDIPIAPPGSIQFSAATYSVNENGTSVTITATRTGGSNGAVGVSYQTVVAGSTAAAGSDYTATSGTLAWGDGVSGNQTFTIPILDDPTVEGNETVNLSITTPTGGATLGTPNTAILTINDNDVAVPGTIQLSAGTYSVNENGTSVTITATRTVGSNGAVGVSYQTIAAGSTAAAGTDYTAASGTLSWANGDSANKTFTVLISDDSAVEGNETVNLSITTPTGGATLGTPNTAILTINDNDVAVPGTIQFSSATYSVNENGTSVTITATRTGGSNGAVGVSYQTIAVGSTAAAGTDYTAASGTLSWANGDSANKTFTVLISDDSAVEGNETVNLSITTPTGGATLGSPNTAVLTINDNDAAVPGTLQLSSATYSVGEAGPSATITVNRTVGSNGAVGVSYQTIAAGSTAAAGTDYTAASGTLSWANGDSANKTFTVLISDDSAVEGNETVNLSITTPTGGATLGSPNTAVLTINDNDAAVPGTLQLSSATYSVGEAGPSATITVNRTVGSNGAVGISYSTSNGTAADGADYSAASGTLSWANGDSAGKTFTINVADDTIYEGDETINITISSPTGGATLGAPNTAVLTINDNDPTPPPALNIVTTSLPDATVGTAYEQNLIATGGDGTYTWSVTSGRLATGMGYTTDGAIMGTPTEAGDFSIDVEVTSAGQTAAATLTLHVNPAIPEPGDLPVIESILPASEAPAGTRITITGFRFGAAQGLSELVFENTGTRVSDAKPIILYWSETEIRAIIPPAAPAGSYQITVVRQEIDMTAGLARAFESEPEGFRITANAAIMGGNANIYPNPFNPLSTDPANKMVNISFSPGSATNIGVYIYDMTARLVVQENISAAQTTWNGYDQYARLAGDGTYILRVIDEESKQLIARGKILVVKR